MWSHQHVDGTWYKHRENYVCPAKEFSMPELEIWIAYYDIDYGLDRVEPLYINESVAAEHAEASPLDVVFFAVLTTPEVFPDLVPLKGN